MWCSNKVSSSLFLLKVTSKWVSVNLHPEMASFQRDYSRPVELIKGCIFYITQMFSTLKIIISIILSHL